MNNSTSQPQRLVLGTAQLGMKYGIANKIGRPNQETATKIIETAWNAGVKKFDTAQGYGESENVLGKAFTNLKISDDVLVISKFNHQLDHQNEKIMNEELEKSLQKLKVPALFGIMLHDESLLPKWTEGLGDIFQKFVHSQKVRHVGFSTYSPGNALKALEQEGIDFIQISGNILDRRFEQLGVFDLVKKKNKNIHIRSIFLQGLLLMDPEAIPTKMEYTIPTIEKLIALSNQLEMSREEIAIGYIKHGFPGSHILFGVESVEQLVKNIAAWARDYPKDLVSKIRQIFKDTPENTTNWHLWPK